MTLTILGAGIFIALCAIAWFAFRLSSLVSEMERFVDDHALATKYVKHSVEISQARWDLDQQFVGNPEDAIAKREEDRMARITEAERIELALQGQQVAFSQGVEAIAHRLDAIAEALDDKKVRVLNVPEYPRATPEYPQAVPRPPQAPSEQQMSLFGAIQAAGKLRREQEAALKAHDEQLAALREQIRSEKQRLDSLASIGIDRQRTKSTEIDTVDAAPTRSGAPETPFDDILRRAKAAGERQ